MKSVSKEWEALCKEFEAAREEQYGAFAAVNRGFVRVANGTGGNPSEDEIAVYKRTSAKLDEVKRRMDAFVKANT